MCWGHADPGEGCAPWGDLESVSATTWVALVQLMAVLPCILKKGKRKATSSKQWKQNQKDLSAASPSL